MKFSVVRLEDRTRLMLLVQAEAAEKMYAALKEVVEAMERSDHKWEYIHAFRAARAALDKADGKS